MQLVRDLAARLTATNDEHAAGWQHVWPGVLRGVEREKTRGNGSVGWAVRPLERPCRDHDRAGAHLALGRVQHEPSRAIRPEGSDVDLIEHRRAEPTRVALQVSDDLVAGHEPVRVVSRVGATGEL